MVILIRILCWLAGVIFGGLCYKIYANRYVLEVITDIIGDITEESGVIPFIDQNYSFHYLPKDKFEALLYNMLQDIEPKIQV
jgi:hypothetical protein